MDAIKFKAVCKNLDGSTEISQVTLDDENNYSAENEVIPGPDSLEGIMNSAIDLSDINSSPNIKPLSNLTEDQINRLEKALKSKCVIYNTYYVFVTIKGDDYWIGGSISNNFGATLQMGIQRDSNEYLLQFEEI